MDEENFDNLFNFVLDNAVNKLEPSLHTRKQRRWRDKKKDKLYCTQISLPPLLIKQIKESNQYLSKTNENFEDVAANNPVFNDNILVHHILMDDTNTDGADASGTLDDDTHTIGTFDDDTLVDNYILDDDDYIYKFI
ncbi:unnamed protein product [Rotaria sp. Silwood1]|nr:unnamed protein product [Rotaria sp. Silwood1]CAF1640555.1 unnamed protein product [Rotaria sp. Silwood1]CAF3397125.1 unnamed protein product [Rotaria sp. Silwood1]